MSTDNIHKGHRQRLKERFLNSNFEGFDEHNILELLLFYALPQKDTNELAHELMSAFGSISAVFDAPENELIKIKGISESSAVLLKLIPSLSRVYMDDKFSSATVLDSTEAAGAFLLNKYIGYNDELFTMICLDNKCKMLNFSIISHGSVNATEVYMRKIISCAIKYNATNVIISHNHPQGFAIPSGQDIITTKKIRDALRLINIELTDHIIVANDDFVSINDSGDRVFSTT